MKVIVQEKICTSTLIHKILDIFDVKFINFFSDFVNLNKDNHEKKR